MTGVEQTKIPGIGDIERRFKIIAMLLMQGSGDLTSVIDASVNCKVAGAVAQGDVALGQFAASNVECHLIAEKSTCGIKEMLIQIFVLGRGWLSVLTECI